MPILHDGLAQSAFPFPAPVATLRHMPTLTRDIGPQRAELMLRFGRDRIGARLYWPTVQRPALTVLLPDAEQPARADALSTDLCMAATTIVLALCGPHQPHQLDALQWASEHAAELGADGGHLMVAGHGDAGAAAAWLTLGAREHGWPILYRQVLLYPEFDQTHPLPERVSGVAPATIVTAGDGTDDGVRYSVLLRRSGIDVTELRRSREALKDGDSSATALFTEVGRSIRRSS